MPPDGSVLSTGSQPGWHSIRPWTPPLSLSVREITSVSATFILSSTLADLNDDLDPSLASLGLISVDDNEDRDHVDENNDPDALESKKKSIISDALAKGLSVNVNGSPWQRVFIRIDDTADEAVIIIYGLMPGRQYDIDLGLVQGDQTNKIRRQVITEDAELETSEILTDPDSPGIDHSTSSDPQVSTPSTSPNHTLPNTPSSATTPLTIEDRLTQLQHALILINTERETLTVSLKSARRDAQKADAALRSEIDILRRASEKHAAAEHRAKQKILSLQEALKRAQTATRETEELVQEVEGMVPELNEKRAEKEEAYSKIKEEADRVRKDRDRENEKEKKKLELMKGELAGLNNRLERLNGKREKLEAGVIFDLEEQLKEVEREIEKAEMDSHGYIFPPAADGQEFTMDDLMPGGPEMMADHQHTSPYIPVQRIRHQNTNPSGTIGRPSPAPIQRPSPGETSIGQPTPLWNVPRQTQAHNHRSASLHQQTPTLPTNPQRRSSLRSVTLPSTNNVSSSSTSLSSSPTLANASSATISTLSSRAPAFEPGRSLKNTNTATGTSSGYHINTIPAQKPTPVPLRTLSGHSKTNTHPQWTGVHNQYDGGRAG